MLVAAGADSTGATTAVTGVDPILSK